MPRLPSARSTVCNRYRLTEKGADLFPVIVALMQWGNRWLSDSGGPAERQQESHGPVATGGQSISTCVYDALMLGMTSPIYVH